jgi:hypothetical protein
MSGGEPTLKALVFVNHPPPSADPRPAIKRALEWGVDVIIAQGTGADFGPYFLGSGTHFPVRNIVENVRPYLMIAHELGIPFIFSVGIAGADVHLDSCLDGLDALCREEGLELDLAVISGEIDKDYLRNALAAGAEVSAAVEHPDLPRTLQLGDVEASERIVGQMGPEPIMAALARDVDGVITGRALDVGLFMAPALRAGASHATSAHFGKLCECGGLLFSPGDPAVPLWAEIRGSEIFLRTPSDKHACTVQGVAGHSFYERRDPFREENPGGYLDLGEAIYEQVDERTVRASGARWGKIGPYTVKLEGAAPVGCRAINLSGIRDPRYLAELDGVIERIRGEVATLPRFAELKEGRDFHLTFTSYGRDAVLGAADPQRGHEHEVGLLIDAVAPTQELAYELCYFAYIGTYIKPYPGRKTTAGNNAQRFSPPVLNVGLTYRWSVWHLLPLQDAAEPFRQTDVHFPRGGLARGDARCPVHGATR